MRSKGVYNLLKLMKHLRFLSAIGCRLTFGQCTFIMSGTSAPLIINVIAGFLFAQEAIQMVLEFYC